MDWYENEVRELEQLPVEPQSTVFYGSSSIRLWPNLDRDFEGHPVANRGFGGSTLAACAHFFDRLVAPTRARSLVVYAGDNDLGDGVRPEQVVESLRVLLSRVDCALPNLPLTFLTVKPSPSREHLLDAIKRFNAAASDLVYRRPCSMVVDVFSPMLDSSGRARREFFSDDWLHMNPAGYAVWRAELLKYAGFVFGE